MSTEVKRIHDVLGQIIRSAISIMDYCDLACRKGDEHEVELIPRADFFNGQKFLEKLLEDQEHYQAWLRKIQGRVGSGDCAHQDFSQLSALIESVAKGQLGFPLPKKCENLWLWSTADQLRALASKIQQLLQQDIADANRLLDFEVC